MATTVDSIISAARLILVDPGALRWSTAELLAWISDAQREIVVYKPEATATAAVMELAVGTKQTLPTAATRLLDVVRNTSYDGSVPGRAIRLVDRETLDSANPNWHSADATGAATHKNVVKNYVYNDRDPRTFYVFPGVADADTAYVDIVYSATPANATEGANISVADTFSNSILNFVLYRAYMKESEYAPSDNRVQLQLQLFLASLGQDIRVAKTSSPNSQRIGTEGGRT
jgi:hypothetical protein